MSAKKLLNLEQELNLKNLGLHQANSPCFEAAEMQASLSRHLRDHADPAPDLARHGWSDADLVFLLSAALLDSQRNR
jgi:hypothetical protein